jgi:hypothetical protein
MLSTYKLAIKKHIWEYISHNTSSENQFFNSIQIMLADSDLRLTGGTHPVVATICNTSPYLFEFSPFVWHLSQFFWCDDVCIYSMGLIYKLRDFLHINWFSEEVLWEIYSQICFFIASFYVKFWKYRVDLLMKLWF